MLTDQRGRKTYAFSLACITPCPGNGYFLQRLPATGGKNTPPPGISRVLEHIARKLQRLPLTLFSSGTADVIGHRFAP